MINMFDMLTDAYGGGNGVTALAEKFGLSQQQATQAVEALLPAFSQGLKRNTSDPAGLNNFLGAMAESRHGKYFDDPKEALNDDGVQDGMGILGHLFGSKDVSRAVAAQASQATGLGQDMLKKMLPSLASMVMGGLFKQSTGQVQQAAGFGGDNIIGSIIEQMMQNSGGAKPQRVDRAQPQVNPMDNPLGQILGGMFGGGASQSQQGGSQSNNPLGDIFSDMLSGMTGQQQQAQRQQPQARGSKSPYEDLFGQMFDSGRQVGDDYNRGMESIFDTFLSGMNKR